MFDEKFNHRREGLTDSLDVISPEAIADMIRIFEGLCSGSLKHIQPMFHCGTAHCFAGWKEVLDALNAFSLLFLTKSEGYPAFEKWGALEWENHLDTYAPEIFSDCLFNEDVEIHKFNRPWHYAKRKWGLTKLESNTLFHHYATLEHQGIVLGLLARGYRLSSGEQIEYLEERGHDFAYLLL